MRPLVLAVLLGSFVACGADPLTPSSTNISGSWRGFSSARVTNFTVALSQRQTSLSGTWTDDYAHGGTITGSKNNESVTLSLVGNAGSCALSYTARLTDLTTMSGTIVGINCVDNIGGALTMTKQ